MTASEQRPVLAYAVHREADIRLRSGSGPLRVRVYWPSPLTRPALLVVLPEAPDEEQRCRSLCARTGMVVLAAEYPASYDAAIALLEWAADHAGDLEADPERLFLTGGDLATAVLRYAAEQGWPPVSRYRQGGVTGE
jgi:acetyl esterase/lipase